ncbi:MAG: hypothetical protein ISR52_10495 [Rhodospirillales bacterium]|nr:hypothetical protein [Rhodospirillales bacterium]
MDNYEASPEEVGHGGNTIALFLGLYLLILAFFILLVSISSLEKIKSEAVMDSLTSTFQTLLPPTTNLTQFQAKEGDVLAGMRFQEQVTGLFATSIQVAKIEIVQPGRQMRILLPTNSLFHTEEARFRESQQALLDRVVASLSSRPPGIRFDMEFLVGSPYTGGKSLPIGLTLELKRAGTFAREMMARGAPPDSIAVGLRPGDPEDITIKFFTRIIDEDALRFEDSKGQSRPEAASP